MIALKSLSRKSATFCWYSVTGSRVGSGVVTGAGVTVMLRVLKSLLRKAVFLSINCAGSTTGTEGPKRPVGLVTVVGTQNPGGTIVGFRVGAGGGVVKAGMN